MNKKFVDVICLNEKNGLLKPLFLLWDDDQKIEIKDVKQISPCASIRSGQTGLMYTCLFDANKVRHLFYDRGKWFVEVNDHVI